MASSGISGRAGIVAIHERLRARILNGELGPGAPISQLRLAEELDVGRTPLREALRMLQEEGLVEAEHNRRMRVSDIDAEQVEAVYAVRIMVESLGVSLSVPFFSHSDVAEMSRLIGLMRDATDAGELETWEVHHRQLHRLFVAHATPALVPSITRYQESAERFRRHYQRLRGTNPRTWAVAEAEHLEIMDACRAGEAARAAAALAHHLARTAVSLCEDLDPAKDPIAVRTAVAFVSAGQRAGGEWR
jgi:DNA-binding GntR family transcriptional regulator